MYNMNMTKNLLDHFNKYSDVPELTVLYFYK